jgi:hypothetical protein
MWGEIVVLGPLPTPFHPCYNHSQRCASADHIDRANLSPDALLAQNGLPQGRIPHEMRSHRH